MAALFRSLIACCFGEKEKGAPGPHETDSLLGGERRMIDNEQQDDDSMRTRDNDERRTQELNQKMADIVSSGTSRMFSPTIGRGNAVYSPVLPTASSSQANLPPPSMSRQPPPQSVGMASQQSRGSHHSSQSSRHSSYKQHPSLVRPTEQGMQLSEDGVSALDGLAAHQSFASGGGNTSQTSIMGYGTMGMGTSTTGRTFQIHRGRPPSRTKPKPTENGAGMEVNRAQTNGVSSKGEVGDEVKPRSDSSSVQPPTSPPRTINNAKIEEGATDRVHFKLPAGSLILQYDD